MKKIFVSLLLCGAIFMSKNLMAQTSNAKMQSVFIYNFTKMISWPASYQSGDFEIGVLGNSPIVSELETMALTKKAGSQTIVVKKFGGVDDISKCHILFIPTAQNAKLGAAIGKTGSNSTLIVTETDGSCGNGAAINFVIVDNKQKFELKEANANKKGLKVGAELIKLAIIVN